MSVKGNVFLVTLLFFSCSESAKSDEEEIANTPILTEFPYKAEIDDDWRPAGSLWFDFYLPPSWKTIDGFGLDSNIGDILAQDSTSILYFDDLSFGKQTLNENSFDSSYFFSVHPDSNSKMFFEPNSKNAMLVSHNSYWLRTRDDLTEEQFEIACKILRTATLKASAFSDGYFSNYDSGKYYNPSPDLFKAKLSLRSRELSKWGFEFEGENLFQERIDFQQHWWLKIFRSRRNTRQSDFLPTDRDFSKIKSIKQFTYKKNWKFIIEEWKLDSEKSAKRWLQIAVKTKDLDDAKPPRVFWREGANLYFVMATAARDWFEHGNELAELISSKKRGLLKLFNEPLDLPKYKAETNANSGIKTKKEYHYQPDTIGSHYRYFWFHHLRGKFREEAATDLSIHSYVYGNTIGNYSEVTEELISVKSRLPDPKLQNFNLVGMSKEDIEEYYGFSNGLGDLRWEKHNDDLIVLHFQDNLVEWFNYVHTNLGDQHFYLLPGELHNFEEEELDKEK